MDSKPSCLLRGTTCRDLFATKPALAFQSTCPLRGTTRYPCCTLSNRGILFQSTCPLRGTTYRKNGIDGWILFQSTCPLRGTTLMEVESDRSDRISIHVPLAGHDIIYNVPFSLGKNFNPRAPCGARPGRTILRCSAAEIFQSTCPLRGTTKADVIAILAAVFQSTCPLRGTTSSRLSL